MPIKPILDRIMTGDEKWVFHENIVRKRQRLNKDQSLTRFGSEHLWKKDFKLCLH